MSIQALRRGMIWVILAVLMMTSASAMTQDVAYTDGSDRPLLMAHYMPWYQTPEVSGYWGWHWTMDHFDPAQMDENGRPQIAAQHMPLTGPYDSQDVDVLEYQVLLMKLSGIDGVIVDWYGMTDFRDYAAINASTVRLFEAIKKAGLRFIICYEDQSIKHMVEDGFLSKDARFTEGAAVMQYMQENWFSDPAYVTFQSQPLLFMFGPQYFRTTPDWDILLADIDPKPALVTLDGHMDWAGLSSFPWPPMHYAGGIEMAPAVLESYLTLFYNNMRRRDLIVGSAFPGFHDIYAEAGYRSSFGYIDPRDGETLRMTMDYALQANAAVVQLVTWNDYGEGTIIEPTEAFGYQYLEFMQETRRSLNDSDFAFSADDLRLPLRLFNLRKTYAGDDAMQTQLDAIFEAIITGDLDDAAARLSAIEAS